MPLLYGLAVAFLALFFVFPIGNTILGAVRHLARSGQTLPAGLPRYLMRVTLNTMILGGATTVGTLLVAVPVSFLLIKFQVRLSGLWLGLLTVPLVAPPFIGSFAMIILFGRSGMITLLLAKIGIPTPPIFGFWGLFLTELLHSIPYALLIVSAGLRSVPAHAEEAARSFGASVLRVQRGVVLPQLSPHILMAGLMVFLATMGDVGAPLIIGGNFKVLSIEVLSNFVSLVDDDRIPIILILWMIVISGLLLYGVNRMMALTSHRYRSGGRIATYDIPGVRRAGTVLVALLTASMLLPYAVILLHSFATVWAADILPRGLTLSSYASILRRPKGFLSTGLLVAASVPLMMVLGMILAHLTRWRRRFSWVNYLTLLPFVLPGVVIGISLLQTFSHFSLFGRHFTASFLFLIIAISLRRLPFVLKTLEAGFYTLDRSQEEVAMSLGAGEIRSFFGVVLPGLRPVVHAAVVIGIVKVITELSVMLVVNPPGWQNMSLYVAYYVDEGMLSRASAMASIMILIVAVGTVLSELRSARVFQKRQADAPPPNWESVLLGQSFRIERPPQGAGLLNGGFQLSYVGRIASLLFDRRGREVQRLQRRVEAAELRALKAQIKPHFLFNTLNGLVELIECDPKRAVAVTQALSDLFRYTLAASQCDTLLLSEELNSVHQYLAIQQVRFNDRLSVTWKVDRRLESCMVPPMILQPLVENAIHHGADQEGNVRITMEVRMEDSEVVIRVADEGGERVPHSRLYQNGGTGIRNVDERLSSFFGRRLVFEENVPRGLCAVIRIPRRSA